LTPPPSRARATANATAKAKIETKAKIKAKTKATHQPGEVRIIGGIWKRTKITVLDREGLRPTPDRVRETLFNWIGPSLEGWRVLDAFAGTGALGFEAASRGAARVVCLERDVALVRAMQAQQAKLDASSIAIEVTDALGWMSRAPREAFELVLLDPPFAGGLLGPAIERAQPLLARGGWLYVEADERLSPPPGLVEHRHLSAGRVHAHLWHQAA
jgi:16S rRNA (guanine966-N2)-methyltransferase